MLTVKTAIERQYGASVYNKNEVNFVATTKLALLCSELPCVLLGVSLLGF